MFFVDFNKFDVSVNVGDYYNKAKLDFETFQVAIYHIIENAAKYVMPNTHLDISFALNENSHTIVFDMKSFYIPKDEVQKIFIEGYSGNIAKETNRAGNGIGMYRVKQLITLNRATIELIAGDRILSYQDIDYSENKFIITIPNK